MQSNSYYLLRSFVLMYMNLHAVFSVSFLSGMVGSLKVVSLLQIPASLNYTHLCDLSVSGQSTAGGDEMSFSISDSKNTVTSSWLFSLILLFQILPFWEKQAAKCGEQPYEENQAGKQCLPLWRAYSKLAKSWIPRNELGNGEFSR